PAGKNIDLKPYVISRLTTDRSRAIANEPGGDAGGDAKFGITANLTADLTVRTDFAQVEVDEQQVNLTRFNLLFPEKRHFFLEGRGLFPFATFPSTTTGTPSTNSSVDMPQLFYSRRIGLDGGRVIPILFGERLNGKLGGIGVGALNIQTGDE